MSTSVLLNGTTYSIPAVGESGWGTNVSSYLVALSTGVLSKAGGTFTLLADVDFGTGYGLKSIYYKSRGTTATVGILRLANTEAVSWRNAANSADLSLDVNASNVLEFNSNPILTLALGTAYTVLQMNSGGTAYSWATPTGTGAPVLATTPTLVTPVLGVASATTINKVTFTTPATGSTLTIADGKTLTASNTLTLAGTDGNTMTFPSGSSTVMTLASTDTITGVKTFGDSKLLLAGSVSGAGTLKAPSAASTYIWTLPAATDTLVGLTMAQTLTTKAFTGVTGLGVRDTSAAFDVTVTPTSSVALTAGRTLTLDMVNGSYTLKAPALSNFSTLTDGTSGQVLSTLGSGAGYSWASALTSTLSQYNAFIGNSSNAATAVNTNLLGNIKGTVQSATVTVTIATPGVVTYTAHGLATGNKFYFTTTGALPTGLSVSTTYYVIVVDANTFQLASTLANAVAGTAIATSGTQSGTHTGFAGGLSLLSEDARIPGKISGLNDTSGYVGEFSDNIVTSAVSAGVTAGQFGNIMSVTLPPGHWSIHSQAMNTRTGGQAEITIAFSAYSANTTTDHVNARNVWTATCPTVGAGNITLTLTPIDISVNVSTTVYLKAKIDVGTWTQANFWGRIMAYRVS